MFICNECLRKHYENGESFMKSRGACEICKEYALCNDIYHGHLVKKKK